MVTDENAHHGEPMVRLTPDDVANDILGRFAHIPMALATRRRRQVDTDGDLWMSVIEATVQPRAFA
jgi:hypothetical protein